MTKEEILHLGTLSRLALREDEVAAIADDLSTIVSYVSQISDAVGTEHSSPRVGAVHNVLRADEVTVPPGTYSKTLLDAAPVRSGQFVVVKKIIAQD